MLLPVCMCHSQEQVALPPPCWPAWESRKKIHLHCGPYPSSICFLFGLSQLLSHVAGNMGFVSSLYLYMHLFLAPDSHGHSRMPHNCRHCAYGFNILAKSCRARVRSCNSPQTLAHRKAALPASSTVTPGFSYFHYPSASSLWWSGMNRESAQQQYQPVQVKSTAAHCRCRWFCGKAGLLAMSAGA